MPVVHQRDPELRERRVTRLHVPHDAGNATGSVPAGRGVDRLLHDLRLGIVDWRACVPAPRNEVPGSHLGMGLRPTPVDAVVARMIASADRFWKPAGWDADPPAYDSPSHTPSTCQRVSDIDGEQEWCFRTGVSSGRWCLPAAGGVGDGAVVGPGQRFHRHHGATGAPPARCGPHLMGKMGHKPQVHRRLSHHRAAEGPHHPPLRPS